MALGGRIADFIIRLLAQDEASDVIDHVADTAEELESSEAEVTVTEDGGTETAETIEDVGAAADEADGKSVEIPVETPGADEARSSLEGLGDAASVMGDAGLTGASGVNAISAASLGAAGAIGAALKVAKESVDAYVAMGIAAQQGGAAVGMSTEEFSRWTQAADDMMIEASALQGAFTALNRKITSGSDAFAQYGISTTDASGALRSTSDIMLDVLDVLSAMESPQAAMNAGTELMGQGFRKLAPLVGTTKDEMEDYLASVDDGLVVTDEWAADSLETAQAQDDLRDSLQEVAVALGQMVAALAPVIVELAGLVGTVADVLGPIADLVGGVGDLAGGLKDAIPNISLFGNEFERMGGPIRTVANEIGNFIKGEEDIPPATDDATTAITAQVVSLEDEKAAAEAAAEAQAALVAALEGEIAVLEASVAAHQERSDALRASADAQFAITDAQVEFNDSLAGMSDALAEAGGDLLKIQQIYDDSTQSADKLAKATQLQAQEAAVAAGASLTAAQSLDVWNRSMLESATKASPEMQRQIVNYVAAINNIPPEQVTAILTTLDRNGIDAAEIELRNLSKDRDAMVLVDSETAAAEQANALLRAALGEPATIPVGADTAPFTGTVAGVTGADYDAEVTLGANVKPADKAIGATASADYEATVDTEADTLKAANDLLNLITAARVAKIYASLTNGDIISGQIDKVARARTATITASANTSAAERELNNVARTRTARINASVSRSNVLVRVDGGG